MDLSGVLAELKSAQDDFRVADKRFATAVFCEQACKALDKVVKEAESDDFENLIIGIWIVIGSLNELLPELKDGPLLTELLDKLFRQCARVVLDIKWQQLEESDQCRQNFLTSLTTCHQLMAPRGFARLGVLQSLLDNPWTDPVLTMVMGSEEDNEEGEGLAYIKKQDPEILKLRVELMHQENCDEFALNLCIWCLRHPALIGDFNLHKTQFILLHRLNYIDKLQEECQTMGVVDSIRLINSLQGKEEHKELCTMLAQTFLVQNWIKPSDNQSKQELLRLWIRLQYQADQDLDSFISSLWAVAKVSRSTEQLLFIIDAVREQCGDTFLQFYVDLCIFAINVDKGCWEKLKNSMAEGPNEELVARKRDMARVCEKVAHIVSHVSPKTAFCCVLTAFTLLPCEQSLQAVRDAHLRKSKSSVSQCCSNCASDQGVCLKNVDKDKASRDVNVATLYEVERLCTMLRPSYLSHDTDFSILFSMCKQYLGKEKGEGIKSTLGRRKSVAVGDDPAPVVVQKADVLPKPDPVRKTVDAGSHVSNVVIPQSSSIGSSQVSSFPGKREVEAQQTNPASAVKNHNIIQQLVLKQLSSDAVQTLLLLIQSGQISPVYLNQIMTKDPKVSMQLLQNILNQAKKGALKSTSSRQQQSPQQVRVKQEDQEPSQMCYPVSGNQHASSSTQTGASVQPELIPQHVLSQARPQVLQARPSGQVSMAGGRIVAPQQAATPQPLPVRFATPQTKAPTQLPQAQILRRMQSICPPVPSTPAIKEEFQGCQPIHIMTLRQTAPLQHSAGAGRQNPVYVQTNSQALTHLSGGNVRSLQEKPQMMRLPSGVVTMSIEAARSGAQSAVLSQATPSGAAAGRAAGSSAVSRHEDGVGNRHYSINNLLFTGEQQTSALSITLPDKLPEISVDSITDTLRALSDSPRASGQAMPKGHQQQVQAVMQPGVPVPITRLQAPTRLLVPVTAAQSRKLGEAGIQTVTRVQLAGPTAVASSQSAPVVISSASFSQRLQDALAREQPLPSISTLLAGNQSPQQVVSVSTVVSSFSPPSSCVSSMPRTAGSLEGVRGQAIDAATIKAENKGIKKNKELLAAHKDEMMKLLRQAMTLKIEKDNGKDTGIAPQISQSSTTPGHRSTVPVHSNSLAVHQSSCVTKPSFQQPSLPGSSSLHGGVRQQSQAVMQHANLVQQNSYSSGPPHQSVTMASLRTVQSIASSPRIDSSMQSQPVPSVHQQIGNLHAQKPKVSKSLSDDQMNILSPTALYRKQTAVPSVVSGTPQIPSTSNVTLKTYSRPDLSSNQNSQVSGKSSVQIPVSILPEGGIMETSQEGNQSIATYRCIICAKAFMTLDALRLHVKQICKPGLAQNANIDNCMAMNKAQATEAGLETSTVFQCMRCFELCISEAGIRQHKLVCKKAPKPKSKSKSKAKSKVPTPEEEKATEARVKELLDKCLGENREKLLQESQSQAARQASDKKKQGKKRPSTEGESSPGIGVPSASALLSTKKPKVADQAGLENAARGLFTESLAAQRTSTVEKQTYPLSASGFPNKPVSAPMAIPSHSRVTFPLGFSSNATSSELRRIPQTPSHSTGLPVTGNNMPSPVVHAAGVPVHGIGMPRPEARCDAGRKYNSVASCEGSVQTDISSLGESTAAVVMYSNERTVPNDKDFCKQVPIKAEQVPEKAEQVPEKETPPPPQYKELKSSGGQHFFKCLNCGQTLCSRESFCEHWLMCIMKKPFGVGAEQEEKDEMTGSDSTDNHTDAAVTAAGRHFKQSVVLLEKVALPQDGVNNSSGNMSCEGEGSEDQTPGENVDDSSLADKSGESTVESSPVPSPGKAAFKKTKRLLKAIQKKSFPGRRGALRKGMTTKRPCDSPAKVAGMLQAEDNYCTLCQRFFSRRVKLIQHLAIMHVQPFTLTREGDTVSYQCHLCKKAFPQYFKYMNHVGCHSQSIVRKFNQMNQLDSPQTNSKASGGREQGINSSRKKENEGDVRKRGRGRPRKLVSGETATAISVPAVDRRSSARAAQKQALNKIYISSLGITAMPEPLKENNKRSVSVDEKSPTDARPKRSRAKKSTVDMDSQEEEENENGNDKSTVGRKSNVSTALPANKLGVVEEASVKKVEVQASVDARLEGSPLHTVCPHTTVPQPVAQVSSPPLAAPKKPSFLDSFLNFVSSRSPEAPLPINQAKRRFSYLSDDLSNEKSNTLPRLSRRSSYDEQACSNHQTSDVQIVLPVSEPSEKSVDCSSSPSDKTNTKEEGGTSDSSLASSIARASSSGSDNVYYYGEFKEQLSQQCKVNLGFRVKAEDFCLSSLAAEPTEKGLIIVKQCIVNLGPKVDPAILAPDSSPCSASSHNNNMDSETKIAPELGAIAVCKANEWCDDSDTDTVISPNCAASPADVTEDTMSLDNVIMPFPSAADEVHLENSHTASPHLPTLPCVGADVTTPVAEQTCLQVSSCCSQAAEAVTVLKSSLDSKQTPPPVPRFSLRKLDKAIKDSSSNSMENMRGQSKQDTNPHNRDRSSQEEQQDMSSHNKYSSGVSARSGAAGCERMGQGHHTADISPSCAARPSTVLDEAELSAVGSKEVARLGEMREVKLIGSACQRLEKDTVDRLPCGTDCAAPHACDTSDSKICGLETCSNEPGTRTTVNQKPDCKGDAGVHKLLATGICLASQSAPQTSEDWAGTPLSSLPQVTGGKALCLSESNTVLQGCLQEDISSVFVRNKPTVPVSGVCFDSSMRSDATANVSAKSPVGTAACLASEVSREQGSVGAVAETKSNCIPGCSETSVEEAHTGDLQTVPVETGRSFSPGGSVKPASIADARTSYTDVRSNYELAEEKNTGESENMDCNASHSSASAEKTDTIVPCSFAERSVDNRVTCVEHSPESLIDLKGVRTSGVCVTLTDEVIESCEATAAQSSHNSLQDDDAPTDTVCVKFAAADEGNQLGPEFQLAKDRPSHRQIKVDSGSHEADTEMGCKHFKTQPKNALSVEEPTNIRGTSGASMCCSLTPLETPSPSETVRPDETRVSRGHNVTVDSTNNGATLISGTEKDECTLEEHNFSDLKEAAGVPAVDEDPCTLLKEPSSNETCCETRKKHAREEIFQHEVEEVHVASECMSGKCNISLVAFSKETRKAGKSEGVLKQMDGRAEDGLTSGHLSKYVADCTANTVITQDSEEAKSQQSNDQPNDAATDCDRQSAAESLISAEKTVVTLSDDACLTAQSVDDDCGERKESEAGDDMPADSSARDYADTALSDSEMHQVLYSLDTSASSMQCSQPDTTRAKEEVLPETQPHDSCSHGNVQPKDMPRSLPLSFTLSANDLQGEMNVRHSQRSGHDSVPVRPAWEMGSMNSDASGPGPEESQETTSVYQSSSAKKAVVGKCGNDSDPENDLPELCIVSDSQRVVIKRNVAETVDKATTGSAEPVLTKNVSLVLNDYEVQVRPCLSNDATPIVNKTYSLEIKKEKVVEEKAEDSEPAPLESPTLPRKPLLGLKSLRSKHKPAPFVWDVDWEEDCGKRARNERTLKAFRQKVSVAPFTWDSDGHCQKDCKESVQKNLNHSDREHNARPLSTNRKISARAFSWGFEKDDTGDTRDLKSADCHQTAARSVTGSGIALKTGCHDSADIPNSSSEPVFHSTSASGQGNSQDSSEPERTGTECSVKECCEDIKMSDISTASTSALGEHGRKAAGCRTSLRSGSCDKMISVTGKNGCSAAPRKSIRKSHSYDEVHGDCTTKVSLKTQDSVAEENPQCAPSDVKNKMDLMKIEPPATGSANEFKSSQQSASSHERGRHLRTSLRSSQTWSSHPKWKISNASSGSEAGRTRCSEEKELEQGPRKLRVKRHLDLRNPCHSSNRTTTSSHSSRKSQKVQSECRQPRSNWSSKTDGKMRSRHTRRKESTEKQLAPVTAATCVTRGHEQEDGLLASPKSLRNRDTSSAPCLTNDTTISKSYLKEVRSSFVSEKSSPLSPSHPKDTASMKDCSPGGAKEPKICPNSRDCEKSQRKRLSRNPADNTCDDNSARFDHCSMEASKLMVLDGLCEGEDPTSSKRHSSDHKEGTLSALKSESLHVSASGKADLAVPSHSLASSWGPCTLSSLNLSRSLLGAGENSVSPSVSKVGDLDTKRGMYLGAMVRRRKQPTSWRKVNPHSLKKSRTPMSDVPQYEIYRVEPVSASPPSEEHSRTHVCEPVAETAPRTVHTKVSLANVKPAVPSPSPVRTQGNQKWLINRRNKTEGRRRNIDPHFPFSFLRARTRTQNK